MVVKDQLVFNYLIELKNIFFKFYTEEVINSSHAFSLKDFINTLKKEMKTFNNQNKPGNKVSKNTESFVSSASRSFVSENVGNNILL